MTVIVKTRQYWRLQLREKLLYLNWATNNASHFVLHVLTTKIGQ